MGDSVRSPDEVHVADDVHRELSAWFDVEYVLGVCGEDFADDGGSYGCRNTGTSRGDFNRVQVNDRATARVEDDQIDVREVTEDANDVAETEIRTFDFSDSFGGGVVPDVDVL